MDHLPPASKPYQPLFVPYLADRDYDGLAFDSYPARRGYDLDSLLRGDFQGVAPESIASFLQTWLWFGLVEMVVGVKVDSATFVRTDEAGRKWLNSEALKLHLQNAGRGEQEMKLISNDIVRERINRRELCFRTTFHTWEGFLRLEDRHSVTSPMSPEVSFGIQVLAISLQVWASQLLNSDPGALQSTSGSGGIIPWERSLHMRISRSSFLTERMVKQGWCPLIIEQIRDHTNVLGQYYASLLGPPRRKLDHSRCNKDEKDCLAMENYQIRSVGHETEDCTCKTLVVDKSKLQEIISKDEIPVLELTQLNGEDVLSVISSSSQAGLEYTAMSHVWSDGWGNPKANSLPACRVTKLVRTIAATYIMPDFAGPSTGHDWSRDTKHDESVYFWIDTLCVPREPSHIHARAIMQMREVYSQAERVLVFDSEIMAATAEASYEELHMRIRCSRWIRRLWTLQEAVLSKRLIFQYAERAHLFQAGSMIWQERKHDLKLNYFNSIGWDCDIVFHGYTRMLGTSPIQFLWLLMIADRAVSVEADEPICGAILMNFDMKRLMEAPDSKRMQVFWQLHGNKLPMAVLFIACHRLTEAGYRCYPSSFLPCQKAGVRFDTVGRITEEGFCIKIPAFSAFTISPPSQLQAPLFPVVLDGLKYFVRSSPVKNNPNWDGLDLHKHKSLALIIELLPSYESQSSRWTIYASRAALVSTTAHQNGIITAQFLRVVSVIQEGSTHHKFPTLPWTAVEMEHGERTPCQAEWQREDQEWCVN